MTKIAVVHFQPIEEYPPVMNFINSIAEEQNIDCKVYTLNDKVKNWFALKTCQIFRIGSPSLIPFKRYWGYFIFNLITFLKLILTRPQIVIAYETYSIIPVFLYKKLYSQSKIFIHYHEYISPNEIKNSSSYYNFIHFFEKKLFTTCDFISQTNSDRLELFLVNNPTIEKSKTFAAPNMPPNNWHQFAIDNNKINDTGVVKLVHVGALGLESMYVKEMIDWVSSQNGKYSIDFYTSNISAEAKKLFANVQNEYVKLLGPKNYFELPKILIKYDIGVTLYNGHIPNYVYNVPNKVFEYLACGLNVWYSSELISTQKFVEQNDIKGCQKIDFLNFNIQQGATFNTFNENGFFEKTTNTLKEKVLALLNEY